MIPESAEWQMVGQDDWVFGEKIRGVVRVTLAQLYFDEDSLHPTGGWRWLLLHEAYEMAQKNGRPVRGTGASLPDAVWDAEIAMGIISDTSND